MRSAIGVLAALALGCSAPNVPGEQEMNTLGSALTKLSAAVDATVRYGGLPGGLSKEEVLARATRHDASLLKPFSDHHLEVRREGDRSAVLVCDKPGGRALLEDAGCTAGLDAHRWRAGPGACRFTLDLPSVCRD